MACTLSSHGRLLGKWGLLGRVQPLADSLQHNLAIVPCLIRLLLELTLTHLG